MAGQVDDQLIEKYRPQSWDEVLGNQASVKSIKSCLASATKPHGWLLKGPPGCGKTSSAFLIAKDLGANIDNVGAGGSQSLIVLDAAINGGIDDTEKAVEKMYSFPLDGSPVKVIIVNECQELSKKAWTPFLEIVEKPPSFAYFIFTTSNVDKVDKALFTRVHPYNFGPVQPVSELIEFLMMVAITEEYAIPGDEVFELIAEVAGAAPRQSLTFLSQCRSVTSLEEAAVLLDRSAANDVETGNAFQLVQAMVNGATDVRRFQELIAGMSASEKSGWGAFKITMLNYVNRVMSKASKDEFLNLLPILDAINEYPPYHQTDTTLKTELNLLIGRYLINCT